MVSWQAFPFLPPSSRTPRVSLAPKTPFSLPFQTPATQAMRVGVGLTMAKVRSWHWIPRQRQLVRKV